MIVDTSAIVAIFLRESGYEILLAAIDTADTVAISAATLLEAGIVLSERLGQDATGLLQTFVTSCGAEVLPFTSAHWPVAVDAWRTWGKGRHPAALNFGDCVTFATARLAGMPLLFVGDDFARTDVARIDVGGMR
jgi:ribonuclease VapC